MMKSCKKCVLDESIGTLNLDSNGICEYCKWQDGMEEKYPTGEEGLKKFKKLCSKMKKSGKGKIADCVFGISGGCDSSYILWRLLEEGVRVLAVHYDNGWNTEIAKENMKKITEKLLVPFISYRYDPLVFDDISQAFLEADVSDADIPNDMALTTVKYLAANQFGIKYIVDGHSFRTEGTAPTDATYMDAKYIKSVYKNFFPDFDFPKESFPNLWLGKQLKWMFFNRKKRVRPLYYLDYDKKQVKKFLKEKFGWKDYGEAHAENIYTKFISNYYLPKKFGIDLRKVLFSGRIRSGDMTRSQAIKQLKKTPEFSEEHLNKVLDRLGITKEYLNKLIERRRKYYTDYKTYQKTFKWLKPILWVAYKLKKIPATFYTKYVK